MPKGKINVSVENIFPLIKKFLYSDQEIFLRELISNATDALTKIQHLSSIGEVKGEIGELGVEIKIDKKKKILQIIDNGVGMTSEEVKKYINDVAFSGAEEFLEKYKETSKDTGIIGHFGLGFYSSFMVADKVVIITKSYKDEPAAHWVCDGSPEYSLKKSDKKERGTEIILHISKDSKDYLDESKITELLNKYNKFMPHPIKFGTKEETIPGKEEGKDEKVTVDNIINNPNPAWTRPPSELKDEDYKQFYRELYPYQFEEPLFHIHLNVDYPFNLTGILYFPKISNDLNLQKDRIQLYQNQVFVTDNVEGIVPEFLGLLKGVIDSPDIPLNVSRSYLQSDSNVRKISNHITKKVADKLTGMFKKDRKDFENKWDDINVFIQYGILTDEKFNDKAKAFSLLKNSKNEYYTVEEYKEKVKVAQTDKNDKLVFLYTHDKEEHHSLIEAAHGKGYDVVIMDGPLSSHYISKAEQDLGVSFARLDADTIDKIIAKDENIPSKLSKEQEDLLKPIFEDIVEKEKYTVQIESLSESEKPVLITQSEFMRRMKEQQAVGGSGMNMMGVMPEMYNLVLNSNHPIIMKIIESKGKKQKNLAKQSLDLALLSHGMLKGKNLTDFVERSFDLR